MHESDYIRQFNNAVNFGDRDAAKSAIRRPRRFGARYPEEAVHLWVAWAGPVNSAGIPISAQTPQQQRKLNALLTDKLCIAGPCRDIYDVQAWIENLASKGLLEIRYDDKLRCYTYDLSGVPQREAPPTSGFP